MAAPIYLEIQGDVSTLDPIANYTRVNTPKGSVEHFVRFLTSAIAPGNGPFPNGSRVSVPVNQEATLYFSDAAYGTPPAIGGVVPLPHPFPIPIVHPPAGVYQASDGTDLTTQTNAGQVVGFTGKSKDGQHQYALSVHISSASAPGRAQGSTPTWMFARMTATEDANPPLVIGFGYCPSDNLLNVFAECANVQTSLMIDYSQSQLPNGTTAMTNNLVYYGVSMMAQTLRFPASQTNPGMYLSAGAALWPYLAPLNFFAPAVELIASRTAALLPEIPPPNTPAVEVGSIGFGTYNPDTLSEASFIYNSVGTVGPALGPLAATAVDPGTFAGFAIASALQWMAWQALVIDNSSLTAALSADYAAWVAWLKTIPKTGPGKKPLPVVYPKDPHARMITYHDDPWMAKPSSNQPGPTSSNPSGEQSPSQPQTARAGATG